VTTITRLTHKVLGCAGRRESTQYETPRLVKSPNVMFRSTFGSNFHSSRPVSGSRAITRPSGVLMNIRPSATTGVTSSERCRRRPENSGAVSPV
jgi:hypothetical protein